MVRTVLNSYVLILLFIFSEGYAQLKMDLKGRVVDKDMKPIEGAQVKLLIAKKSQITDNEGRFIFFFEVTSIQTNLFIPALNIISFHNGVLSFNVFENQQRLLIEMLNIRGQIIKRISQDEIGKGSYNINFLPDNVPDNMYFIKVEIGRRSSFFKAVNLKTLSGSQSGKGSGFEELSVKQCAEVSGALDVLEISKDKYETVKMNIHSYFNNLSDIVLKSNVTNNDKGLPPVKNGRNASTTRYWDCCKPHCGWHSNMRICDKNDRDLNDRGARSSCEGGPAYQCWDYAPFEINSKVSYAWAAFNNREARCGDCFQLDLQGDLRGKQMIVQIINIGDGGMNSFDLLIPGGGVGQFDGCSRQWNNAPLGKRYGGFHSQCGEDSNDPECIREMCKRAFGNKKDLMRGCEWYLDWFEMAHNPKVVYKKVSCPKEIKKISRIGY